MWLTDTNSLLHKIETENVYKGFNKNKELLDFRNYSKGTIFMIIQIK